MAQPPEVAAQAEFLVRLYAEAHARLIDQLRAVVDEPRQARRAVRLRGLIAAVQAELAALRDPTAAWVTAQLPAVYAAGATEAAAQLGSTFTWTAIHRDAVQALAGQTWSDLLAQTQHVASATKRALRQMAADATRATVLESQTPAGAARDLAAEAHRAGLFTVRYADGAEHSIADWADTAIRTRSAEAYTRGELNLSRAEGVTHMRCFDGAACGLTNHQDGDKPNGRVFPIDVADAHPLAHPRCARSWSPEPLIRSASDAENARTYNPDQQARMAAEEAHRAATATTPLAGRSMRVPRQPRTPRATRGTPTAV